MMDAPYSDPDFDLGLSPQLEVLLGVLVLTAWAAAVLWGLGQTALSARKGHEWDRAYLTGVVVGCALGAGVALAIKDILPFDAFGLGFLLAAGGGFAIWVYRDGRQ
jgi:hypothetical protein